METFELTPVHRKSFYGKCKVIKTKKELILMSYDTRVASYDKHNREFKCTSNESHLTQTTLRHIAVFRSFLGLEKMTKKELLNLNQGG